MIRRALLRSLIGGGFAYLGLFIGVHVFLAATTGPGVTAANVLQLLLVGGAQTVLVLKPGQVLPLRWTLAVCAALELTVVIGLLSQPLPRGPAGYDAWYLGADAFVLLGLAVRSRITAAWATLAAMTVTASAVVAAGGGALVVGPELLLRHAATLAVGTALAISLRRSAAAEDAFRALEVRRRAEERASRARIAARREAVQAVLQQAEPMLTAIAEGRRLSDADRRSLLVLEGALRDQIRVPRLARTALAAAVADARGRGVNVLLLDEAQGAPETARRSAAAWLGEQVARVPDGRFVGRIRVDDGHLRVTAVTDEGRAGTVLGQDAAAGLPES